MKRRAASKSVNDDAFIVKRVGAAPEAPLLARRNGSSGVVDRRKVTGWIARETWEILLLPVGKEAGKGIASMKIQTPVRRRACTATGAPQGGHEPRQAPAEPFWLANQ